MNVDQFAGRMQQNLADRVTEVQQNLSITDKVLALQMFWLVPDAGETLTAVRNFPFAFVELPCISSGYSLLPGNVLVAGQFPQVTVGVKDFVIVGDETAGVASYTGATFIIVAEGHVGMTCIAHCTLTGRTVMGPTRVEQQLTDPV